MPPVAATSSSHLSISKMTYTALMEAQAASREDSSALAPMKPPSGTVAKYLEDENNFYQTPNSMFFTPQSLQGGPELLLK